MKTLDIVGLGEPLVEFNQRGADARDYRLGFGGDTSNCVIAAARMGARCAYISQVGDDRFGDELLALWRREGVATEGVRVVAGAPTGLYFVHHGPQGHRFSYRRAGSAASLITPQDLPRDTIAGARFLHCSGISQAISASAREAVAAAIDCARAHGTRVSHDLNFRPALWSAELALATLRQTLAHCDLFFPSVDELRMLAGMVAPHDILAWARALGARQTVLKLGERGCVIDDGAAIVEVPGVRVQAVDATGAGDCFAGVCLAQLAQGAGLAEAAAVANRAAALSTQGWGAVDPLPRREDVLNHGE